MLPARNRRDYDDIPEEVRQQLEFIWLERIEEAMAGALEPTKDPSVRSDPDTSA
jgi:ATP-dependent Lon protease